MSTVQEFKSCRSCGYSHMNSSLIHRDRCPKCGGYWYWGWICPKCKQANHYREYYEDAECNNCGFVPGKQSSSSSGGCFITTATLLSLGKDDNCRELNLFRNFRDTYVKDCYPSLILEYYKNL